MKLPKDRNVENAKRIKALVDHWLTDEDMVWTSDFASANAPDDTVRITQRENGNGRPVVHYVADLTTDMNGNGGDDAVVLNPAAPDALLVSIRNSNGDTVSDTVWPIHNLDDDVPSIMYGVSQEIMAEVIHYSI